jgi:hypothetical protein
MFKNFFSLIPRGVPFDKLKTVTLYLFDLGNENLEKNYSIVLREVFDNIIPDSLKNAPTFTENKNLEEFFAFHLLTKEGVAVEKQ